jgi:DNA polymerase III alpha subunit
MNEITDTVDELIKEIESLQKFLKKKTQKQVQSNEEKSLIKSTSFAYFNNHRLILLSAFDQVDITGLDEIYRQFLTLIQRATARNLYVRLIKEAKAALLHFHSQSIITYTSKRPTQQTSDQSPDFLPLISDVKMRHILQERWRECTVCIQADAPLSATVMMGGLLEALLLARINRESNKAPIFKSSNAPKDKAGKTKPLNEWMLRDYIDVAQEMKWISQSARDVGVVLRDYRNYIHPYKELSHGISLITKDAIVLWEVCKSISRQILESV